MRGFIVLIFVALASSSVWAADRVEITRTWTNVEGKETEAVYLSHDEREVTLKKGPRVFTVSLASLSERDRDWIRHLTKGGFSPVIMKKGFDDPLDRGSPRYEVRLVKEGTVDAADVRYDTYKLAKKEKVLEEVWHELSIDFPPGVESGTMVTEVVWESPDGRFCKGRKEVALAANSWSKLAVVAHPEAKLVAFRARVWRSSQQGKPELVLTLRDHDKVDINSLLKRAKQSRALDS